MPKTFTNDGAYIVLFPQEASDTLYARLVLALEELGGPVR